MLKNAYDYFGNDVFPFFKKQFKSKFGDLEIYSVNFPPALQPPPLQPQPLTPVALQQEIS